jgi:hypothetical protein
MKKQVGICVAVALVVHMMIIFGYFDEYLNPKIAICQPHPLLRNSNATNGMDKAYILSVNEERYQSTSQLLWDLFLYPIRTKIVPFTSETIQHELNIDGNPAKPHQKILSNKYSHRLALQTIATDPDLAEDGWGFIFEDDIALADEVTPQKFQKMLTVAKLHAAESGFLYLGICAAKFYGKEVYQSGFVFQKCSGPCAHAYGVTKWRAAWLYDELSLKIGHIGLPKHELYFMDVYFRDGFALMPDERKAVCVGNVNKPSIGEHGHHGVIVQDRKRYPAEIYKTD